MPRTAPYGSWRSPITPELAAAQSTFVVDVRNFFGRPEGSPASAESAVADRARDILLERNDVVIVEREAASVQVSGLVRRPGLVAFDPKLKGEDYIERANLRIRIDRFDKELLRSQRRTVGRLDGRFIGIDRDAAGESPDFDPSYAAIFGEYTAVSGCRTMFSKSRR